MVARRISSDPIVVAMTTRGGRDAIEVEQIERVRLAPLTFIGGTIGGSLAYDYGFNVETAGDHPVWHVSDVDVLPGHKEHPA